jgi:hypothetical protein
MDPVIDALCQGLLKEYMKRKGFDRTLATFLEEQVNGEEIISLTIYLA